MEFKQLPKTKQRAILNAGMKYFGKCGFQKARCEDIAREAEISKGLLFYYFKNKKDFYFYLYHYCECLTNQFVQTEELERIDDFFDLMDYGARRKALMLKEYPYLLDFVMQAFHSEKEAVSKELNEIYVKRLNETYSLYFKNIRWDRFKPEVDPKKIYQMLLWMSEGYLIEQKKQNKELDVDQLIREFHCWKIMFRKWTYRKEYL